MSVGDIYHDLLENTTDGSYEDLISRLAHAGYVLRADRHEELTDQDLADADDEYFQDGPEAAVDFLETTFGFTFDEPR